jgi:hypothetical protein
LQLVSNSTLADAQAVFDVECVTEKLNLIADWKDELRGRFAYTVNDIWGAPPDYDELRAEVERFKLACKGVRT